MHARILNGISLIAGAGFSLGLFASIAQFLSIHEQAAPEVQDELVMSTVSTILPPPPPPRPDERPAVVAEAHDAVPLGIQEEPSASPVRIPPSPPVFEELLPIAQIPTHVVTGMIGIDTSIKPTIDVTFDTDRVYQKGEVDKSAFLIAKGDQPPIPARLMDKGQSIVVVFVVDTHGIVGTPRILRSSGNEEFDSIILKWIREWRFSPGIKDGKPVRQIIQQLINFQTNRRDPFSL